GSWYRTTDRVFPCSLSLLFRSVTGPVTGAHRVGAQSTKVGRMGWKRSKPPSRAGAAATTEVHERMTEYTRSPKRRSPHCAAIQPHPRRSTRTFRDRGRLELRAHPDPHGSGREIPRALAPQLHRGARDEIIH